MEQGLFPTDIVLNDFGWHATHQRISRHVSGDDCASRDYGTAAYAHTFENGGIKAYPHMVLNDDRRREIGIAVDRMVVAIADGNATRNSNAMTNGDGGEAVDSGIVVDVAATEAEFRAIVNCEMKTRHQVKMPLDVELRILGQLEFGWKIAQPRPLATQFKFPTTRKGRRSCAVNAYLWENFNAVAFFLISKLRSSVASNKRSLGADLKEVFQLHCEIIPNARWHDASDYCFAQHKRSSL